MADSAIRPIRATAWATVVAAAGLAVPIVTSADEAPLFADDAALTITFDVKLGDLCLEPERGDCPDLPARITYAADDGSIVGLDVRVRTRGRHQKNTSRCKVPALFLYFDESQVQGTLFDGQSMLPLTTHCHNRDKRYHMYTLLEFLGHRIYNLITDASLRVRLVKVEYLDGGTKPRFTLYGFFSEHFRNVAARLGAEVYDVDTLEPRLTDANELAAFSLFQFMIANLDWSVIKRHNVELFRLADGKVVAVPFDLDYSGIVNAEYAGPPDWARIRRVTQRIYRGFCRPEIDWDALFERFLSMQNDVMALVAGVEGMSLRGQRHANFQLNRFFKILRSEKKRNSQIVEECRPMPSPLVGFE